MSLADVDEQELGVGLVLLVEVFKRARRLPERGSGVGAEDQHQWLLAQTLLQLHGLAGRALEREIRSLLANLRMHVQLREPGEQRHLLFAASHKDHVAPAPLTTGDVLAVLSKALKSPKTPPAYIASLANALVAIQTKSMDAGSPCPQCRWIAASPTGRTTLEWIAWEEAGCSLEEDRARGFHGLLEASSLIRRSVELGLSVRDAEADHEREVALALAALNAGGFS